MYDSDLDTCEDTTLSEELNNDSYLNEDVELEHQTSSHTDPTLIEKRWARIAGKALPQRQRMFVVLHHMSEMLDDTHNLTASVAASNHDLTEAMANLTDTARESLDRVS